MGTRDGSSQKTEEERVLDLSQGDENEVIFRADYVKTIWSKFDFFIKLFEIIQMFKEIFGHHHR